MLLLPLVRSFSHSYTWRLSVLRTALASGAFFIISIVTTLCRGGHNPFSIPQPFLLGAVFPHFRGDAA